MIEKLMDFKWKHYEPELDKLFRRHLKKTNNSWRVDETYIEVKETGCTWIVLWISEETPLIFI
nr:hypothetical protein [Bacillus toyonensis]